MKTSNLAYKRIVIKFGTSLLTGNSNHLDMDTMEIGRAHV
jgi:glutamate 5-kinase